MGADRHRQCIMQKKLMRLLQQSKMQRGPRRERGTPVIRTTSAEVNDQGLKPRLELLDGVLVHNL